MESAWQLLLNRLASPNADFTYDDVCGWSADEFEALTGEGLISEIAQATRVVCDACQKGHWERVRWSGDRRTAFITCPLAGIVDVAPERLRRWQASPRMLAVIMSKALTQGESDAFSEGRMWFLGRHRAARHRPCLFFAAIGPDGLSSAIKSVREAYGHVTGILFVPFPSPTSAEGGRLTVIDIGKAASLKDGKIIVDVEFVSGQFRDSKASARSDRRSPKSLRDHRLDILQRYGKSKEIEKMNVLATHLRMGSSVLYAMVRSDTSKYGDTRLGAMLDTIGCSRAKWDRAPNPVRR